MLSVKESSIEMIKNLPPNCTLEDIQYKLYVKQKIENGLEDVRNDNVLSEKEMDNEIRSWQS